MGGLAGCVLTRWVIRERERGGGGGLLPLVVYSILLEVAFDVLGGDSAAVGHVVHEHLFWVGWVGGWVGGRGAGRCECADVGCLGWVGGWVGGGEEQVV